MTKLWRVLLPLTILSVLTACSDAPPECADAAASQSLRRYMDDSILEALPLLRVDISKDPGGTVTKYLASWSFELSNVATEGYDEKSKTRSCRGRVTISVPDLKQTRAVDFSYAMQRIEAGKGGEFQLLVDKKYQRWSYDNAAFAAGYFQTHGPGRK